MITKEFPETTMLSLRRNRETGSGSGTRPLSELLQNIAEDFYCFLFPPKCILCGVDLEDGGRIICNDCQRRLLKEPESTLPFCPYCRSSYPDYYEKCRRCGGRKSPGKLYALYEVNDSLRYYLHHFKYHRRPEIGMDFARKAYGVYGNADFINEIDLIIPVPMHKRKQLSRGYNQAEVLAKQLAGVFKLPVNASAIKRLRNTKSQTYLDPEKRFGNVKGAFRVESVDAVKNKTILLVDDIVTTGATLTECSRVLRKSGAKGVISFAVMRQHARNL
ncbi:MAG: ComF family protein [candidate division Zixibacteria bacterium]|nr:ComF family protein [candidate division Zixibacteria bacterium]